MAGKEVLLGSIAELKTGPFGTQLHANEYVSKGIPVINVRNIGYGNILTDDIDMVSKETVSRLSEHRLCEKDIVFGRKGSIDRHAFIDKRYEGWMQGSDCIRVRVNDSAINPKYISHYLKLDSVKKQLTNGAVGSTMPSMNTDILKSISIFLPDKTTQDAIEEILSIIEEKIANNTTICTNLESMAKVLYDYWFVQFDFPNENGKPYKSSGGKMVWNEELKREIPEGWQVTTIGNITACHDSERIPVANKDRAAMSGNIPYYGATGVMGYVNKAIFSGDYVLLAEDGSIMDGNGHPIIQRISGDVWVNNHAHVLEPIRGYSCRLLMMILKDIPVIQIKTGSIQMKINQDNMNRYRIIDIPEHLVKDINQTLNIIDEKLLSLDRENRQLASLRDFLLPMLMNGQVKCANT